MSDDRFTKARNGSDGSLRCDEGRTYPGYRPLYLIQYRCYGEHGTTTVGLSGHKALPLYTGGCEATRFSCDVVYTNVQAAGAYRGYGATQGIFALESAVNELAEKLHMDPVEIRMKNMSKKDSSCRHIMGRQRIAVHLINALRE